MDLSLFRCIDCSVLEVFRYGMGIGMIIIGLASVIIGEAIFGTKTIMRTTLAVIAGAIIYRIVLGLALRVDFLDTGDMKLITAVIVIAALILPQYFDKRRENKRKAKRHAERLTTYDHVLNKGGNASPTVTSRSASARMISEVACEPELPPSSSRAG